MNSVLYKLAFHRTPQTAVLGEGARRLLSAKMCWSNQAYSAYTIDVLTEVNACEGPGEPGGGESYLGIPMDEQYPEFAISPPANPREAVYRVYFSRPTDAAYAMKPADNLALLGLTQEARTSCGARQLLAAYMRWNNESWEYFGVERFPNLSALIAYSQFLTANGWYRYTEAQSYLGLATGGILSGIE